MKQLTITVNKMLVYNEVAMATGYKGAKENAYDKVFTTDADQLKLEAYWIAGCDELVEEFGSYVEEVTQDVPLGMVVSQADLTIKLMMPDNYNTAFNTAISNDCFLFLADYVTARWFDMVGLKDAETYMLLANTRKEHIHNCTTKRVRGNFAQIKPHWI